MGMRDGGMGEAIAGERKRTGQNSSHPIGENCGILNEDSTAILFHFLASSMHQCNIMSHCAIRTRLGSLGSGGDES